MGRSCSPTRPFVIRTSGARAAESEFVALPAGDGGGGRRREDSALWGQIAQRRQVAAGVPTEAPEVFFLRGVFS